MPETPAASHGCLIINPLDAINEIIIQGSNSDDHSASGGASDILPRFLGQTLPPILKGRCRRYCPILPRPVIIILRGSVRWLLRKRKQVRFKFTLLQSINECLGIFYSCPLNHFFIFDLCYPDRLASHDNSATTDLDGRDIKFPAGTTNLFQLDTHGGSHRFSR